MAPAVLMECGGTVLGGDQILCDKPLPTHLSDLDRFEVFHLRNCHFDCVLQEEGGFSFDRPFLKAVDRNSIRYYPNFSVPLHTHTHTPLTCIPFSIFAVTESCTMNDGSPPIRNYE